MFQDRFVLNFEDLTLGFISFLFVQLTAISVWCEILTLI